MHAPEVLKELALLLAAAVLIVYVFRKLRQPAILGFLVCGALIGPHGLALIREVSAVETLAEVGAVEQKAHLESMASPGCSVPSTICMVEGAKKSIEHRQWHGVFLWTNHRN